MLYSLRSSIIAALALCAGWRTAAAQTPARTADGKPDLNGIWQALVPADWDLQAHAASAGPIPSLAADFAIPPGTGIVEGNGSPYLPELAAKKKQNFDARFTADPEVKCYLPGVPRATYMPYPFQIIQSPKTILISYEYAGAVRSIDMGKPGPA